MKRSRFVFKFKNGGTIAVYAFNTNEAKILAQAEAIRLGWDYEVVE